MRPSLTSLNLTFGETNLAFRSVTLNSKNCPFKTMCLFEKMHSINTHKMTLNQLLSASKGKSNQE